MKVLHIVGARPNFMKAAPVLNALSRRRVSQCLVHTGQHYDQKMSNVFFDQLGMPKPDINLGIGSGSHTEQTANTMLRLEEVLLDKRPDWVIVYGDINSTVAATLTSVKLGIKTAHVEAGLRSYDRSMPEEINRMVTDSICDLHLTPSPDANENLIKEGIDKNRIHFVGNVMIDTLKRLLPKAKLPIMDALKKPYALVTLHRPANVDEPGVLKMLFHAISNLPGDLQAVFPIHPRTACKLKELGIDFSNTSKLLVSGPLGYLEFLALQKSATVVITDSGGVQEETTFLRVPCLTMRENTERPITITQGTNTLIGMDVSRLHREVIRIVEGNRKSGEIPKFWDGNASERIAEILLKSHSAS